MTSTGSRSLVRAPALLVAVLALPLGGCAFIGDVFKTGVGVGVGLVLFLAVAGLAVFGFARR